MSKETQNTEDLELKKFDFENAKLLCEFPMSEIYESKEKMRVGCNTNGNYYLVVEPRYSGLETAKVAYSRNKDGRKPSFSKDKLEIYQDESQAGTDEEFACLFSRNYEGADD